MGWALLEFRSGARGKGSPAPRRALGRAVGAEDGTPRRSVRRVAGAGSRTRTAPWADPSRGPGARRRRGTRVIGPVDLSPTLAVFAGRAAAPMERTGTAGASAAPREEAWPYRSPQRDPWGRECRGREVSQGFKALPLLRISQREGSGISGMRTGLCYVSRRSRNRRNRHDPRASSIGSVAGRPSVQRRDGESRSFCPNRRWKSGRGPKPRNRSMSPSISQAPRNAPGGEVGQA